MLNKILNTLKDIFTSFFSPLARQIAKGGGALLINAAMEAVVSAEQHGGSGSDKLKYAKDLVIARLKMNGIPLIMVAINGALEASVARMNEGK